MELIEIYKGCKSDKRDKILWTLTQETGDSKQEATTMAKVNPKTLTAVF